MTDIKPFVDSLVATGIPAAEAEIKVKAIIEKIKIKRGENIPDADVEKLLKQGFAKAASSKGDKINGVCIGYTPIRDKNKKYMTNVLDLYNDPATKDKIVADGAIKFEDKDGKTRMYIVDIRDKIGNFDNKNKGKEMKPKFERDIYFVTDTGEFFTGCAGAIEPKLGGHYHISSKTYGKRVFITGLQQFGSVTPAEMWAKLTQFATHADIAQLLNVLPTMAAYDVAFTTGFIKRKGYNQKNNQWWVAFAGDSPDQNGFGTSANDEVAVTVENAVEGAEVYVMARIRPSYVKDGQTKTSFDILGIFVNPDAELNNDLFTDMDIIITE